MMKEIVSVSAVRAATVFGTDAYIKPSSSTGVDPSIMWTGTVTQ